MNYKVFIPCAGKGKDLGNLNKNVNKALITIANKPIISHIIEKFDDSIELVIALGYKGNIIRDLLLNVYPNKKFTFVDIDKYDGDESSLGYTLLKSKDYLQCPFIFCSSDTIVEEMIPPPSFNWVAYSGIVDSRNYRSVRLSTNSVLEICSKGAKGDVRPYIGLAGISDYETFWSALSNSSLDSLHVGESIGLRNLIESGIVAKEFTWYDTGNLDALRLTRSKLKLKDEPNILEKEDESIWFVNNQVVKFSIHENFISGRVFRSKKLNPFVPEIIWNTKNLYAYSMVDGEIFSKKSRLNDFMYLLDWLSEFWSKEDLSKSENISFNDACVSFYKDKTYSRVDKYFKTFEQIDSEETINGVQVPKVKTLLDSLDWDWVCKGVPTRMHGDLHFENILITNNTKRPFALIDWRQDFGGILNYGDLYYDLAKLNHGLIISHELINKDLYSVYRKVNNIEFDFLRKQNQVESEFYLKKFVESRGWDYKKVEIMTYLIFLNIAALHHYPYGVLLFNLGKLGIFRLIKGDSK